MAVNMNRIYKPPITTVFLASCVRLCVVGLMYFWILPFIGEKIWGDTPKTYYLSDVDVYLTMKVSEQGNERNADLNIGSTYKEQSENELIIQVGNWPQEMTLILISSEEDNKLKAICFVDNDDNPELIVNRLTNYKSFVLEDSRVTGRLEPVVVNEAVSEAREKGYIKGQVKCVILYVDPWNAKLRMVTDQQKTVLQPIHR